MKRTAFGVVALVAACGGSSNPTPPKDLVAPPDMICQPPPGFLSECGQPCEVGNSKGVGKFCQKLSDCFDNGPAALCTTLGAEHQYFCTMTCKMDVDCGENARCACQGHQCGCFPTRCDSSPPPDGGANVDGL